METRALTVQIVKSGALERFVSQIIGREFEYMEAEECDNDTDHLFEKVRRVPDFNRYKAETPPEQIKEWFDLDTRTIQKWVDAGGDSHYPGTHHLLQWLCVHRHIEPDDYLIRVAY